MTRPATGGRRRLRPLASVRSRLLVAFVVLLVGPTLGSTLALRQILSQRAVESVDRENGQDVEELRRLAADARGRALGGDARALFDLYLASDIPNDGEAVYTFIGTTPYRASASAGITGEVTRRALPLGRVRRARSGDLRAGKGRIRYLAVPVKLRNRRGGVFAVVQSLAREERAVTDAVRVAAGVTLIALLAGGAIAFVLVGRVLSPLRELKDTARAISDTDLTRRLEAEGDDELAELARSFNAMLDRLEAAFSSQREFVSDAGHELRTPITIIRGHLELLGDDPDEQRETVALLGEELDRMSRFVDDLLTLAKAERSDFLLPEEVDIDELAEKLIAKASGLAPRDWELERVVPGRIVADRQRLTQAVMNLAHNAVQHTEDGDHIGIGATVVDGDARLWVRDSGPGVAPEDAERIFERFARAGRGPGTTQGAGLGLSIVRAIAVAHGGTVELDTPPGGGATFAIVIPAEPPRTGLT